MDATAIICDYAQVNGGKLYIVGAAINLVGTPSAAPPHPISLSVGVLVTIPWNAHNQVHRLKISLVSEDAVKIPIAHGLPGQVVPEEDEGSVTAQFNAGRGPLMQAGEATTLPLAVPLNVAVPSLGGYSVIVELDGSEMTRAKFRVLHSAQISSAVNT
ncbi:DUF6941 family protein [Lentzea flaviverrucosa]|uniref:Uncharacterized protein n=1 Tax=Lentzea flaviverrucosa TaxID=200379 RepID=A0A1H9WSN2_9PSEU|nr:hypothetical protein [Lentzea flaviverrucosa]RDI23060.1 hypothetical protein DFR72_111191 [Lentzea flaviverrucosa]SES36824.1 hypothetical protein SAMN05216195_112186 [Lentzea flaviverrucosa]